MEYGILPLKEITEAYQQFFGNDCVIARNRASILAREYNCEVIVFRVVGKYKPEINWHGEEDSDGKES
jgi:lauroyl/myristoyl acyltransferase